MKDQVWNYSLENKKNEHFFSRLIINGGFFKIFSRDMRYFETEFPPIQNSKYQGTLRA